MNDFAVRVEGVSKRYRIGTRETYKTLRDSVADLFVSPFHRAPQPDTAIWALRDVSFEVKHGDALGIIGHNGAGKSTLLKILSRITAPTEGRARLRGRVAALLEVGTGFNLELTGRENISLNGAILGMKRREIERKFDEIVAFAEVEKFIDTPVKRYSTGMYLRLAFAVAAHLEPEVLVVDEVLAVGDAAFQKKCLGKMGEVTEQGRTVLFVSHNMSAVQALCRSAILLDGGRLTKTGTPDEVIRYYLEMRTTQVKAVVELAAHPKRTTSRETAMFQSLRLLRGDGSETSAFPMGKPITFEIGLDTGERTLNTPLIVITVSRHGTPICQLSTKTMIKEVFSVTGSRSLKCCWEPGWLAPDRYTASLILKSRSNGDVLDVINDALVFEVEAVDAYGTGKQGGEQAILFPRGAWRL